MACRPVRDRGGPGRALGLRQAPQARPLDALLRAHLRRGRRGRLAAPSLRRRPRNAALKKLARPTNDGYCARVKYIFVTGGVVSSLGKGLTAAALGALLELRGLKVRIQKFDPYLNV